jgi:hypothetical protein
MLWISLYKQYFWMCRPHTVGPTGRCVSDPAATGLLQSVKCSIFTPDLGLHLVTARKPEDVIISSDQFARLQICSDQSALLQICSDQSALLQICSDQSTLLQICSDQSVQLDFYSDQSALLQIYSDHSSLLQICSD